ncbi:MAG: sigma-70 family RNA polymerase sigma factor [Acidobacteriota bacterium]
MSLPGHPEDHLPEVLRVAQQVARRNALSADEAEEYVSWAQLRILENDYAKLRQFQGRSKLSTFLRTVLQRLFLDYRDAQWGRWRPSAAAKRLGRTGILLDTLLHRDGLGEQEAVETAFSRLGEEVSRAELEQIAAQLPARVRRRFENEERLYNMAAGSDPERDLAQSESQNRARQVTAVLVEALETLEEPQQAMVRLRYREALSVADIARLLDRDQRKLYAEFDRLGQQLRRLLEASSVSAKEVRELLGWNAFETDENAP